MEKAVLKITLQKLSFHADIRTEVTSDSQKLGVGKTKSVLGVASSSTVSQHVKIQLICS